MDQELHLKTMMLVVLVAVANLSALLNPSTPGDAAAFLRCQSVLCELEQCERQHQQSLAKALRGVRVGDFGWRCCNSSCESSSFPPVIAPDFSLVRPHTFFHSGGRVAGAFSRCRGGGYGGPWWRVSVDQPLNTDDYGGW